MLPCHHPRTASLLSVGSASPLSMGSIWGPSTYRFKAPQCPERASYHAQCLEGFLGRWASQGLCLGRTGSWSHSFSSRGTVVSGRTEGCAGAGKGPAGPLGTHRPWMRHPPLGPGMTAVLAPSVPGTGSLSVSAALVPWGSMWLWAGARGRPGALLGTAVFLTGP